MLDPLLEDGEYIPQENGEGPFMDFDIGSLTMKDVPDLGVNPMNLVKKLNTSWLIEQYNLSTSRRFLDQGTKERQEDYNIWMNKLQEGQIEARNYLIDIYNKIHTLEKCAGLANMVPSMSENDELKERVSLLVAEIERVHCLREYGNKHYRDLVKARVTEIGGLKMVIMEKRDQLLAERKHSFDLEQQILKLRMELATANSHVVELDLELEDVRRQNFHRSISEIMEKPAVRPTSPK